MDVIARPSGPVDGFRHEALFYAGENEFLDAIVPFLRDGLEDDEPSLVVVSDARIRALRGALGDDADRVRFADMAAVGHNPACIIPAWQAFVEEHGRDGRPLRGVGEPVFAGRAPAELAECEIHESLLNLAFAGSEPWWLVCPYDTATLDDTIVEQARSTHPIVWRGAAHDESTTFVDPSHAASAFPDDSLLPEPPVPPHDLVFGAGESLHGLREFVAGCARGAGFTEQRALELVLAVNELAANSLRHGGGRGLLRVWPEQDALVCEVRDGGHLQDPLVGRQRPVQMRDTGRGLWMANQLCDLVQLRQAPNGAVVRVHMRRRR